MRLSPEAAKIVQQLAEQMRKDEPGAPWDSAEIRIVTKYVMRGGEDEYGDYYAPSYIVWNDTRVYPPEDDATLPQ